MTETRSARPYSRRTALQAVAWGVPTIAVAGQAPAMAVSPNSQRVGILFDGGGGSNGWVNTVYVNLMAPDGQAYTTTAPMTFIIDVVGLNEKAQDERSFDLNARQGTSVQRGSYNPATRTTRLTWTVPAGSRVTPEQLGGAKTNLAIEFLDGASSTRGAGRITNKVVVRSVTGGVIVSPTSPPIDSSIVRDVRGISPDGIY